jgi:hypothetical protein
MKDRMDIEDLFKDELGNQEVTPSSKSFAGSRVRHIIKKLGGYVLSGSVVVAMGVAGTLYFYNAAESTRVKDLSGDTPSIIQQENTTNTSDNKKTIAIQIDDNNSSGGPTNVGLLKEGDVGMIKNNQSDAGASNEPSNTSSNQNLNVSSGVNSTPVSNKKSVLKSNQSANQNNAQNSSGISQTSANISGDQIPSKILKPNETRKAGKSSELNTPDKSLTLKGQVKANQDSIVDKSKSSIDAEHDLVNETTKKNLDSMPIVVKGSELDLGDSKTEEALLTQAEPVVNLIENNNEDGGTDGNSIVTLNEPTTSETNISINSEVSPEAVAEVADEIKEPSEAVIDSTESSSPAIVESKAELALDSNVAVNDSSKTTRRFKFTLGALYVNQMNSSYSFDYNSFFSYSIQSGIKYPIFNKKIQLNTGIDYTSERHHFYKTNGSEGEFTEVNEIHLLLRKIEIHLSIDYKLPIKSKFDFRSGIGVKFSKIFSDDEEAWNDQEEIVEHPEEENSFIVDGLHPTLTLPFLYLQASKDFKNIRANLQLYYYFRKPQMDGFSETFVLEYFRPSSLRFGVSVDF